MRVTVVGGGDAFGSGGRFNTCLHVQAQAGAILLDCGASTPVALNAPHARHLDRNGVGAILLTHFHGDHFAGVPFLVLDAQFVTKRTTPLIVAGPVGVAARVTALMEMLYPGSSRTTQKFDMSFMEISPGAPATLLGVAVEAFAMRHDEAAGPCQGYRLTENGRTFAYSGDTAWCDSLPDWARDADVAMIECYQAQATGSRVHMDAPTLIARRGELTAKRLIVTHLGPSMLAPGAPEPAERSFDGMVIEL